MSRRAEGVPKPKKNVTTLSGVLFRNLLGNNFFSVGPPAAGNSDLVVFWPVLGPGHLEKFWAQKWPKKAKNGPCCLHGAPCQVRLPLLMDKIQLGNVWVRFRLCLNPFDPKAVSVGPQMGPFGPRACPAGGNREMAISRARGPESQFGGDIFHVKPPTLGGFHPSE